MKELELINVFSCDYVYTSINILITTHVNTIEDIDSSLYTLVTHLIRVLSHDTKKSAFLN